MKTIRILFLGDLVGNAALDLLSFEFESLVNDSRADLVAINGENVSGGFGLGPREAQQLFSIGVSVISSGNHIWQRKDILPLLDSEPRILRPANYPPDSPGHGSCLVEHGSVTVAFLNLQGRERMGAPIDCPFRIGSQEVARLRDRSSCIVVDFHAEDVREKEAMAFHLDGQVSAVLGTHTHVQTADERISPGGTAAISDLGMCGPVGSVIGTQPGLSIQRSRTQIPLRMELHQAAAAFHGVLVTIETDNGRATDIERVQYCPGDSRR